MNTSRLSRSVVGGALLACSAVWATPVSIPGSGLVDLASRGFVDFPTTQPRVVGSSLLFDNGAVPFEKLLSMPVYTASTVPAGGVDISLTLNLTMRPCAVGSSCNELVDWDPLFLLGDGSVLFGVQLGNDGFVFTEKFLDSGTTGARTAHAYLFHRGAPNVGDAVDIGIVFSVSTLGTNIAVTYDGATGTYANGPGLNPGAGLSFVFMRDNDFGNV